MLLRLSIVLGVAALAGQAAPMTRNLDRALLDPAYPNMLEWAKAGYSPAANESASQPEQIRLNPGDDLVAAVAVPHRIITLSTGTYQIMQPLRFASGVTLRAVNPTTTKLVVRLRGRRPTAPDESGHMPWTSALLLEGVQNSGIENLTILYDDSLSKPLNPREGSKSYIDNPRGQDDLHVAFVRFSGSTNCWISNCVLTNSGNHPLILESSGHITVDGVEIEGVQNKGEHSGNILISGSNHCLLNGLVVNDINHLLFADGRAGKVNHHNVVINSRLNVDVRFQSPESKAILLQECLITVPAWHNFPPISLGWSKHSGSKPADDNLVYFCTITRDFGPSNSSFSVADNPNMVYRILANSTFKGNVEEAGPVPQATTLWPVK